MRRLLWYGNSSGSDCNPNSSDNPVCLSVRSIVWHILPTGSNKKLSVLEQRSLTMLFEQLYNEPYLSCSEDNFISKVPLLCECYRTPLFSLTQAQFYKRVVDTFEAHAQQSTLSWDSSKAIRDAQLPRVLLPYYLQPTMH
jgi:hypothetical protein